MYETRYSNFSWLIDFFNQKMHIYIPIGRWFNIANDKVKYNLYTIELIILKKSTGIQGIGVQYFDYITRVHNIVMNWSVYGVLH